MTPKLPLRIVALGACALFDGPLVSAQTLPPAPAPASADKDSVITLSPFEVSSEKDHGYQAASGISATAVATPLKESPAVVGVLTRDFLDDVGARSVEEAAGWGANLYFMDVAEGEQAGESPSTLGYTPQPVIRGSNGGGGAMGRDYFITNAPTDAATVERVDLPRGPNASLFGAAPLVGMVNVASKKALLQRQFRRLEFRTDSNGSLRGTADVNVGKQQLAMRVNAMAERSRGWRDSDEERNRLVMLSGTWRIARNTTLRAEALLQHQEGSFPPAVFQENMSKWDGVTVYNGPRTTNLPAVTGTVGISNANDYLLFDSTNGYSSPLNWRGFGTTAGYGLAMFPDAGLTQTLRPEVPAPPVLPSRDFSLNPRNPPMSERDTRLFSGTLEHLFFGRLAAQIAGSYTFTDMFRSQFNFNGVNVDINQVRPDGTPNPRFGEYYSDGTFRRDRTGQYTRNLRVLLSYPFQWGFMDQRIVGMAGTRSDARNQLRLQHVRTNGTNRQTNNLTNRIYVRRYESDGDSDLPFQTGTFNGIDVDFRPWTVNYTRSRTSFWQVAMSGRYWDGKVTTTAGLRRDKIATERVVVNTPASVDDVWMPDYSWSPEEHFDADNLTLGAVYFPVPWLGVFANSAEGYNVQGVRTDLFGNPWATPKFTGTDVGLKLELFGGRISGTVSRYKSKRTGVDAGAASPQNNFGQLWINMVNGYNSLADRATTAGDATLAARYRAEAARAQTEDDLIVGTAFDSRTLQANGWELDLTANLTRNWRATLNVGLPETKQTESSPISSAYFAKHRAEWEAHANDTENFNTSSTQAQLKAIEDALRVQGDGASTIGTPNYTANVFTTYRIPAGRLKGLRFGGGVQLQGPRIIGVPVVYVAASPTAGAFQPPDPLATIKSKGTEIASGMVAYEFTRWQRRMKVQLNIANLLDRDELIFTNVATYTAPVAPSASNPIRGYQVLNRFRYLPPRTYTLSFSVDL